MKPLDTEDLERIKGTQDNYNLLIYELGQFLYDKLQVESDIKDKERFIRDKFNEYQLHSISLNEEMFKKYGKGKIDIDKGIIEPI